MEWLSKRIITQSNVNGVYGYGFDELKVRVHNKKVEEQLTENTTDNLKG